MSKQRIGIALFAILLISIVGIAPAQAQGGGGWSEPYLLSSEAGKASEATLVADQYGYVHCFWTETLFEDQRMILQYARFDGATWSAPNDIYITALGIENMSSVVDQHGRLHIVWTESVNGPVYYTYAAAASALSVQSWAQPLRIDIPAGIVRFLIDSNGVFHILYVNRMEEIGVYYVRSKDQGNTWSQPVWLDPDILPAHTPDSLNFELDENDGLHAVWFYGALDRVGKADWVRYVHSLDGGETWSSPFMIDQYVEESRHNLTSASPVMTVQGQTVHVLWAAGRLPYRHHRYSTDAGRTWSEPVRIFGELHGQALDGMAVDRVGRVYFLGQIRYPYGIYEAHWDQGGWSQPSLAYLIAITASEEEGFGDRVHAHFIRPIVRAGNQLVLTFSDPPADPKRRLFAMYRTLDDIAPLETLPTPTLLPGPPPSGPEPTLAATPAFGNTAGVQPLRDVPKADAALQFGIIPVLILLAGAIIFRLWYKNKP